MQLSKRLSAVAEFVTPGGCLVDVGTDHGYVPIALLEQKKISSAIAMDVNRGPLLHPSRIQGLFFIYACCPAICSFLCGMAKTIAV